MSSKKTLTLYLLRHGETEASREHLFCGSRTEFDLTPEGQAMAENFAQAYRDHEWRAIYSSPQRRARATAAPLCMALGIEPEIAEDLREIDYGSWEGLTTTEVNARFHDAHVAWGADPGWHAPTGGETGANIALRVLKVIDQVRSKHKDGDILMVSHKATIRVLLCALLGIDVGRFRVRFDCPTASLSIVELTRNGPMLRTLADRSHLSAELRELAGT